MKKFIITAALFALIFCFSGCEENTEALKFAPPVTVFENRTVTVECGEISFSGTLSASAEELMVFSLSSPENIAGMKIEHSASGDTTQFQGLTYNGIFFKDKCMEKLFSVIQNSSSEENLTKGSDGFSGITGSGDAYTVVTDELGNIKSITLGGVLAKFE